MDFALLKKAIYIFKYIVDGSVTGSRKLVEYSNK